MDEDRETLRPGKNIGMGLTVDYVRRWGESDGFREIYQNW